MQQSNLTASSSAGPQPIMLASPVPATQQAARVKKLVKKGKKRISLAFLSPAAAKKKKTENVGESIEEEEEEEAGGENTRNDSGFQSNVGESIYEDFDN